MRKREQIVSLTGDIRTDKGGDDMIKMIVSLLVIVVLLAVTHASYATSYAPEDYDNEGSSSGSGTSNSWTDCLSVRIGAPNRSSGESWYHVKNHCSKKVRWSVRYRQPNGRYSCEGDVVQPGEEEKMWGYFAPGERMEYWGCDPKAKGFCGPQRCN